MQQNKVILRGKLDGGWSYDHERSGEVFYKSTLLVERFSGVKDEVPVVAYAKHIDNACSASEEITLEGSFRSRNLIVNGKSTLQLYFFVDSITDTIPESTNYLHIEGYVCKEPVYRITPLDREITDLLIAVNRNTKRSDYLPCIAWGRNASWSKTLKLGDKVVIEGRIQSRKFTKRGDPELNTRTAYEISISSISRIQA